jgi:starch synthase
MYSLKYGTVPVVRETGGLADTIQNYDSKTGQGTGFTFKKYVTKDMLRAISRAVKTYKDRKIWQEIQKAGMQKDFSWKQSAEKYMSLYEMAMTK